MTDNWDGNLQAPPAQRAVRALGLGLIVGALIGGAATAASDRGLAWPELRDLPDTIWVALITTVALIAQGWLTARREERLRSADRDERARDRTAESDRREQERADALEERWRDERKQAHADLLEAYSLATDAFRTATSKADLAHLLGYTKDDRKPFQDTATEAHERVEKQLSVVHLLASTSAAAAAEDAVARLRGVWMYVMSFDMYEDNLDKWNENVKTAKERLASVHEVRDAYRQAARQDIGTI